MRLLRLNDDDQLSLTTFAQDRIPPYAILSHVWDQGGNGEVLYQDIIDGTASGKRGYQKVLFCGRQARIDNLHYFWVDTCSIDKTNSTELQTAINSMFKWYQNAARCYVYMSDLVFRADYGNSHVDWESAFRSSQWFTRGWTLQELLAPSIVIFYSRDGVRLGDKQTLQLPISRTTGIKVEALAGHPLSAFTIEERLQWASGRRTTLEEDNAYCILGILGVFLPLIYGEGKEYAMRRLHREIREHSADSRKNTTVLSSNPLHGGPAVVLWSAIHQQNVNLSDDSPAVSSSSSQPINNVYIAIIGPRLAGKTTFIDTLTGRRSPAVAKEHAFVQSFRSSSFMFNEQLKVHLIDTPGIQANHVTTEMVLGRLLSLFGNRKGRRIALCGMIYLENFDSPHFIHKVEHPARITDLFIVGRFPCIIGVVTPWIITSGRLHLFGQPRSKNYYCVGCSLPDHNAFGRLEESSGEGLLLPHTGSRNSALTILEWPLQNLESALAQTDPTFDIEEHPSFWQPMQEIPKPPLLNSNWVSLQRIVSYAKGD